MTVYCRDCDNVHSDTRGKEPWKWRCMHVPAAPGYGFVDPDYSPHPPYERCSKVRNEMITNDYKSQGNCPMFTPLRKAKETT